MIEIKSLITYKEILDKRDPEDAPHHIVILTNEEYNKNSKKNKH